MQVTRIKKESSSWGPKLVASDGENYFVHCARSVWRDKGKRMEEVAKINMKVDAPDDAPNRDLSTAKHGMVFADGGLWACGNTLQSSTDRGASWHVVEKSFGYLSRMVATSEGFYVCGMRGGGGGVIGYRLNGGTVTTIHEDHSCAISAICVTQDGVLFGDIGGGIWLLNQGQCDKINQIDITTAYGASTDYPVIWDAFVTQTGTVLLAGPQGIQRSVDGGKTFVKSKTPSSDQFSTLSQLPSGELVAVGMTIAASTDDGEEFSELLEFTGVGYMGAKHSCVHRGAILVASPADGLFSVSP